MINTIAETIWGANKNINRDTLVKGWQENVSWLKVSPWKIQYNEFGFTEEAEAIRGKLKDYTGFSKTIFPKEIGLPRKNQLKVWYDGKLLWDYGQEQRFPSARELIERTGISWDTERYKWTKQ